MTNTRIELPAADQAPVPRPRPVPRPSAPPRHSGELTSWDDARGFGFVAVDGGIPRLFVHISAFPKDSARPREHARLDFEIERGSDGRSRAINLAPLHDAVTAHGNNVGIATGEQRDTQVVVGIAVFVGFLAVLATLDTHWGVPRWVFALYGVTSLSAFLGYAMDKRAAKEHQWRVREGTLLALGILGGWPGAILAQQVLHHKTRKVAFRRAFWGTVALNIAALIAFDSPTWVALLRAAAYR
jgi:uncharacterized membrane protein YsdA (DUF1294 family)/cold shock CspA family protein